MNHGVLADLLEEGPGSPFSEGEPGSVFGLFQGRVYHHPKRAVVRCFVMSSHEQFKDDRFHIFPILNDELLGRNKGEGGSHQPGKEPPFFTYFLYLKYVTCILLFR